MVDERGEAPWNRHAGAPGSTDGWDTPDQAGWTAPPRADTTSWGPAQPTAPLGQSGWPGQDARFAGAADSDPWGGQVPDEAADPGAVGGPPVTVLLLGLVIALAGLAFGLIGRSPGWAVPGWLLAGPLAIGALSVFVVLDAKRRARRWYAPGTLAPWLRRLLVVVALVAIAVNAWVIADAVARGRWP